MKNNDKQIIKQAEEHVNVLFETVSNGNLLYHNLDHTRKVVDHANEIASHYELSEREIIVLNLAAWFHDTGHLYSDPAGHEQKSTELMREWLSGKPEYADYADETEKVILATKLSTAPNGLLQEIIKDADTFHLGTSDFKKMDKLLRKELSLRNLGISKVDWKRNTIILLESHQFYTSYCSNLLEAEKLKNMGKVKKKIEKIQDITGTEMIAGNGSNSKKDKSQQSGLIAKGIQTMLRLTSENHMKLSEMADNKANILISVNAIIISVILSVLIRKIEVDKHLAIPTFIFLATGLTTIVLSILATRPKITKGSFTREDILNRKTNLLFFGNFYKSQLDEYKWGMGMMMKDPNYLYGTLVDDIYYLGIVLGRKYRLVRIAYSVFMIGIIVSAFAFIIAITFNPSSPSTTIIEGSGSPF